MKDFVKEIGKWAIGAVIASVVLVGAVYFVLNPIVQRTIAKATELSEKVAQQDLLLKQQQDRISALEITRAQVEKQLGDWKSKVGSLINDDRLTADLRTALQSLRELPPDQRNFVAWMDGEPLRIDARVAPIAVGLENLYSFTNQRGAPALPNLVMPAYNYFAAKYKIDTGVPSPYPMELKVP